jgi:lipopolysaccharide export system permease protein
LFTGTLFKVIQMFIGKIDLMFIAEFFIFSVPYLLSYAIPMAFLTAVLLVFGQLSAENEITALKASGVSIYRVIIAPIAMALLLTIVCVIINDIVLPVCQYKLRQLRRELGTKSPTALIEPGVFIDHFDGYLIYIDEIDGVKFKNISIQQEIPGKLPRFIKAEYGSFEVDTERKLLILKLYDVLLEQQSEKDNDGSPDFIHARMGMVPVELNLDADYAGSEKRQAKRMKDYKIRELLRQKRQMDRTLENAGPMQKVKIREQISEILTEINTRLSLAFSCLAFLFIGVSLGIRTHRSEKTVGIPVGLALFAVHYGFTLFGKALKEYPDFFPYIIVWIPNVCLGILGIFLLRKIAGR